MRKKSERAGRLSLPSAFVLRTILSLTFLLELSGSSNAQQSLRSISTMAGKPDAVFISVPNDPCMFLYERMPKAIKRLNLDFGVVKLNKQTLFLNYCEARKKEISDAITSKIDDAKSQAKGLVKNAADELKAGFWKFMAEQLYDRLPAEEQFKYRPGSAELEALAQDWLNDAPNEFETYAAAYLTAGGAESRIFNAWKTYSEVTNGLSKQGLDDAKDVLKTGKKRLGQLFQANEKLADATPDTPVSDILKSVGLSGEWIDNFKKYEGEFQKLNAGYKIADAMTIMSNAIGSKRPSDKIQAFFELIELSGSVAADSPVPLIALVGDIIEGYGKTAKEMLKQTFLLEDQIQKRNGYCLGVGVPSRDTRQAYFVEKKVLACPLAYGTWPFKHVYQSQGAGPVRFFFYDGKNMVEGNNSSGRAGVIASINLINAAIDLGYQIEPDPSTHIARVAAVYNTSDPRGISGILDDASKMVATIDSTLKAIDGLSITSDSCRVGSIVDHVAEDSGLSVQNFKRDFARGPARLANAIAASFVAFEGNFGTGVSRGADAYEMYAEFSDVLSKTSVFVLEGTVVDSNRASIPNAFVNIRVRGGEEVRSCEAWQADDSGKFFVYAIGTKKSLSINARAATAEERGESETFDQSYFRTNAFYLEELSDGIVAQSEGELRILLDPPEEAKTADTSSGSTERQNSEAEGSKLDNDKPETKKPETDLLAEQQKVACKALEAGIEKQRLHLKSVSYDRNPGDLHGLEQLEASAEQIGGCAAETIAESQRVRNLVKVADQQIIDTRSLLRACEPGALATKMAELRKLTDVNLGHLISSVDFSIQGIGFFETARQAYLDNYLVSAKGQLTGIPPIFANDCPNYVERVNQGLDQIAKLQAFEGKMNAAIDTCEVSTLTDMSGQISERSHIFFAAARGSISSALIKCGTVATEQTAEKTCTAATAHLNAARDFYKKNLLSQASAALDLSASQLNSKAIEVCPKIPARIKKGRSNIVALKSAEGKMQAAIEACSIEDLKSLRDAATRQTHVWFKSAIRKIDEGLSTCENSEGNVCDQLPDVKARTESAFASGKIDEALALLRSANHLTKNPESIVGCEDQRDEILEAQNDLVSLIALLDRSSQVIGSCDVEGINETLNSLAKYGTGSSMVVDVNAKLEAATETCAESQSVATDENTQVAVQDVKAKRRWRGEGQLKFIIDGQELPIDIKIAIDTSGTQAQGKLSTEDSEDSFALTGSTNSTSNFRTVDLRGAQNFDGTKVSVRLQGTSVGDGPFKGEAVVNLPQIECLMEGLGAAIGGAIAGSVTLGLTEDEPESSTQCPMEDHSFNWQAEELN